MLDTSTRRRTSTTTVLVVVVALLVAGALANPASTAGAQDGTDVTIIDNPPPPPMPVVIGFAKYDGIDGESVDANHRHWTDILSLDWGAAQPTAGATGVSRRRGAPQVEDLVISFYYEKASPKLEEKMLKGEVIPRLEIELVDTFGGARATYLRYELKNVMITSFDVHAAADTGGRPIVTMSNNFEEIKVTYTEYDAEGKSKGNTEYEWKVEKGA